MTTEAIDNVICVVFTEALTTEDFSKNYWGDTDPNDESYCGGDGYYTDTVNGIHEAMEEYSEVFDFQIWTKDGDGAFATLHNVNTEKLISKLNELGYTTAEGVNNSGIKTFWIE